MREEPQEMDLDKRAIEDLPVVSSVHLHAGDKTHKTGVYANLRCCAASSYRGCGVKLVRPIHKSIERPTTVDCLREFGRVMGRSVGWPRSHGKIKGHCRHHARQGELIDMKNHLGNASGSALASHLLQQGLGHGTHRWCTACSRVRGRGHGSNSCGPNLMVQGCTRTKQTFWTEDGFTVKALPGIRNRDVRVAEIVVRELENQT